jgi:hypothetical protein
MLSIMALGIVVNWLYENTAWSRLEEVGLHWPFVSMHCGFKSSGIAVADSHG